MEKFILPKVKTKLTLTHPLMTQRSKEARTKSKQKNGVVVDFFPPHCGGKKIDAICILLE